MSWISIMTTPLGLLRGEDRGLAHIQVKGKCVCVLMEGSIHLHVDGGGSPRATRPKHLPRSKPLTPGLKPLPEPSP